MQTIGRDSLRLSGPMNGGRHSTATCRPSTCPPVLTAARIGTLCLWRSCWTASEEKKKNHGRQL